MAEGLPLAFPLPSESAVASYDFADLVSGKGVIQFYPNICYDGEHRDYILDPTPFLVNFYKGFLEGGTYLFDTQKYNKPLLVRGDAFLSGYVDYSEDDVSFKVTLYLVSGGESGSLGEVEWESSGEVTHNAQTWSLEKTIDIDDYVYKGVGLYKNDNVAGNYLKYTFYYEGGETESVIKSSSRVLEWTAYEVLNPKPLQYVTKIEIYLYARGSFGAITYEKETEIYSEELDDYSETAISDEITSETYSKDHPFLIKIPLTNSNLKVGDRIRAKIELTATSGGVVVDPTNQTLEYPTLTLNFPFKIDL